MVEESTKRTAFFEWVACPKCSHKMFKVVKPGSTEIEMKCPSCKAIITIKPARLMSAER